MARAKYAKEENPAERTLTLQRGPGLGALKRNGCLKDKVILLTLFPAQEKCSFKGWVSQQFFIILEIILQPNSGFNLSNLN